MSLTPQGPGWWQASDLLWYPPEQKPGVAMPRPTPGGARYSGAPQYVERVQVQSGATSGAAIASLVLSIVWIGGLGSLLAVIFGLSARGDIRRSNGRVSGDGLAIAGLIIGIVGLVGSIFFYISLFSVTNELRHDVTSGSFPFGTVPVTTIPTTDLRMGQSSPPFYALAGGRITVYSLRVGVTGEDPNMSVPAGESLAVANVKECAGAHSVNFALATRNLSLVGPDTYGQEVHYPDYVQRPVFDWSNIGEIGPNRCVQGLIGFTVNNTSVSSVVFPAGSRDYSWTVPSTTFG
jgi:Domain of unknown function (DUF4190)